MKLVLGAWAVVCCLAIMPLSSALANPCGVITELLPKLLKERTAAGDIYTLRTEGGAQFLLLMEKIHEDVPPADDMLYAPWQLLTRGNARDPSIYCEMGSGNRIQILQDIHDANPSKKFGLPGSGFPRCSDGDILDAIQVRMWANKELGDSYIFYLAGAKKDGSAYTLLVSTDGKYWILLEAVNGDAGHECYRARGDDTLIDSFSSPKR